jgi:hypothetical protein
MGRKSASGSRIRDEQPGSYFLELRIHFFGLKKYLNSLMRIRDGDSSDPGSGVEKKVGFGINIPDPQHCKIENILFLNRHRKNLNRDK